MFALFVLSGAGVCAAGFERCCGVGVFTAGLRGVGSASACISGFEICW